MTIETKEPRFEKSGPYCYKAYTWSRGAQAYTFDTEVFTPRASARRPTLLRLLDEAHVLSDARTSAHHAAGFRH